MNVVQRRIAGVVLGIGLAGLHPASAQPLPELGTFTAADTAQLRNAAGAETTVAPCRLTPADGASRLEVYSDNDTAHYARGSVLVVLVFVNHGGGTWTPSGRTEQAAKAALAKQYYLQYKPAAAFLTFDNENQPGYYAYTATLPYDIATYGDFENWMVEDAAESLGFADTDGDDTVIDEMTIFLQGAWGGWDNVITVFIPADYAFETAEAGWLESWCKVSHDMSWGTMAHEWGHVFGACDEGGGPAGCNNIGCAETCMSYYLVDQVPNANCSSCPGDVPCIMQGYVNVGPCAYTIRNWGWADANDDGLLDPTIAWDPDAEATYTTYELFHNGWFIHTNTTWGWVANQKWDCWSAIGVRSRGASNYAISVFGDNNRNHHLASDYISSGVRFVVGDFNHNNLGEDHIRLTNLGGAGQYVLSYEAGGQSLYPDGVDRAQTWSSTAVVKTFDVPLFAGETISFQLDIDTPGLDLGMALFRSNGGTYYAPRTSAVWQEDDWPAGISEAYTYDVPADDVYGLVVWSNNEVAGNFHIQIGPTLQALAEATPFTSNLDLRLFSYAPYTNYWAVSAARPGPSTNLRLRLFGDANFTNLLATSGAYPGVEFVAADYNLGYSNDYLRVDRQSGVSAYRTEWEQGEDLLGGFVSETWSANHVAKVWDAHLLAGQTYRVQVYENVFSLLDTGVFLMSSAGGNRYVQRSGAATGSNGLSSYGEWFTYTPAQEGWYGVVVIANDDNSGTYSAGVGPYLVLPEESPVAFPDEVIWADVATQNGSWAVLGVRPAATAQSRVDLWNCQDRFFDCHLDNDASDGDVAYLVIDGNHDPAQTYYARVDRISGLGTQSVSFDVAHENDIAFDDLGEIETRDGQFGAGEVVQIWDLNVAVAPVTARITVVPQSTRLDVGLAVFDSHSGQYIQDASGAVAAANANGPGQGEEIELPADHGDVYGLVVTNVNGVGGSYRIFVNDAQTVSTPAAAPLPLALLPGLPNPFNPRTTLRFTLPAAAPVDLAIYDQRGRRVRRLLAGEQREAGAHAVVFDGRDDAGMALGAGVYLSRLEVRGEVQNQKLTLVK
jgi:hypothetical protein